MLSVLQPRRVKPIREKELAVSAAEVAEVCEAIDPEPPLGSKVTVYGVVEAPLDVGEGDGCETVVSCGFCDGLDVEVTVSPEGAGFGSGGGVPIVSE